MTSASDGSTSNPSTPNPSTPNPPTEQPGIRLPAAVYNELLKQLNDFVGEVMRSYELPKERTKQKVVRDAVHGYQILSPHEVEIIDSPLVQRLRFIHQTALAHFVYPSANHTRLEHSLGVAKVAEQMALAINRRAGTELFDQDATAELRLAALLHDVGHTFFSHLSEQIMEWRFRDTFKTLRRLKSRFESNQAVGEILSYMLLMTPAFTGFLKRIFKKYDRTYSVPRIASLIVGRGPDPALDQFKADIISGPFDADKLDYLIRDCYFTGIRSDVDVERVYYTVSTLKLEGMPRYMAMEESGISILEQILFNKMLLFTSIYHHHKIRTLECMVKAVFEEIEHQPERINHDAHRFRSVVDFLRFDEDQFFRLGEREPFLAPRISAIRNRRLLKRCLEISRATVNEPPESDAVDYRKLADRPDVIRDLREIIFDSLPANRQTAVYDFWVDIPKGPNIDKDAQQCFIVNGWDNPKTLRDTFPIQEWLESYEVNKWKGHVFYIDDGDDAHRQAAAHAASAELQRRYRMEFKADAWIECKLAPPPLP